MYVHGIRTVRLERRSNDPPSSNATHPCTVFALSFQSFALLSSDLGSRLLSRRASRSVKELKFTPHFQAHSCKGNPRRSAVVSEAKVAPRFWLKGSLHESFGHLLYKWLNYYSAHVENVALYPHERF